jgi:hypothetical protein
MDKPVNMEKLFKQKLKNLERDTTVDFDDAMERKIDRLYWSRILRWMVGMVIIAGLALVIPFSKDSSDSKATHLTETQNEHVETKNTALTSHQEELEEEANEEKQKVLKKSSITSKDSENLSVQQIDKASGVDKLNFLNRKPSFKDKSIKNAGSNDEKTIIEQKEISFNRTASPNYLDKQLLINSLSWKKPPVNLKKKQKTSPTTMLDEAYLQQERIKTFRQLEREFLEIVKSEEKKQQQIKKDRLKAEKEEEKKKRKEQKIEKQQKRKQAKIEKRKVPGIYEGAVELSVAPLFVKNLSPALEPQNDTVTNWLTNKNFKNSYDLGIEFMFKPIENNWLVKTGLHYQNLSEDIDFYFLREYIDPELSGWIYDSIFEYHIDPPNFDTVLVGVDSSYYEHWERTENARKYTNRYQFLNIPILLGYQIDLRKPGSDPNIKRGFDVHALVGTGLGILLKSEGYYYDANGYIYAYPDSQKTTIDWYLNAQIAINYHWKNISFFAKPKLQFQMGERSFDNYFENRHYLMYGVDFGVRIKIFQ